MLNFRIFQHHWIWKLPREDPYRASRDLRQRHTSCRYSLSFPLSLLSIFYTFPFLSPHPLPPPHPPLFFCNTYFLPLDLHKIYYHMTQQDQEKETKLLAFLRVMVRLSKNPALKDVCKRILTSNQIGPIVFVCPELGKWSTAGGLGVMVSAFFFFFLFGLIYEIRSTNSRKILLIWDAISTSFLHITIGKASPHFAFPRT